MLSIYGSTKNTAAFSIFRFVTLGKTCVSVTMYEHESTPHNMFNI